MERHRIKPFPSPFDLIEEDPEKKLWVPGRKKIFLPTRKIWTPTPSIWAPIDFNYQESLRVDNLLRHPLINGYWSGEYLAECVPSRGEYLGQPREIPITWNDITRSTRPAFRNRRFGV